MAAAERVRIPDLARPIRSELQEQARAWAEANPLPRITVEAVLEAARRETGLSDFGAADFLERLRVQVDALAADPGLHPAGRAGCFAAMVVFARNRLQLEDLVRRHPQILALELEPLVLIAGLPRSGTTFLHNIMAADPRLRATPYWEAIRPVAEHWIVDGVDTRWQLAQAGWEQMDRLSPVLKMVHPFTPDHICEDVELSDIDFGSYTLEWHALVPAWRDYQASHDFRPTYRYLEKAFKALTFQTGGSRRWVTKCPQHMERLEQLRDVFPDASFLINHRDPVASIQSAITGLTYSARIGRHSVDPKQIAEYWIDRYERLLRACVAQRDRLDPARSLDIYFHELMADPRAVLARAYEKIGMPFDTAAHAAIDAALAENRRGKHGQLVYDLRADFGLEPAAVRERFGFYLQRFPKVEIEVR